ncbi:hypothetical protein NX794_26620 [Streptomyces sp. LP11]|uniref:Uncharacterized protein n=1 Tax=Streptomyces pyxinicus TaxID=2970331 RepID=A0ABT2B8B1_9ACTN|nr:hypothetical protein [Streptomyces sp. LP11]MCS0604763.1 hypothetical protein [Streptomyces sp. LP11]
MRRPARKPDTTALRAAVADKDAIISRYRAREPMRAIAADYRVSESWLRDRLDAWGVPRRPPHEAHLHRRPVGHVYRGRSARPRTSEEVREAKARFDARRDAVVRRYLAGESALALARAFALQPGWVRDRLDDWGVPRRDAVTAAALARYGKAAGGTGGRAGEVAHGFGLEMDQNTGQPRS